jgi:transposase
MLYIVRTGCPWRHLPHDFAVTWSSTHKHFLLFTRTGLWSRLLRVLREQSRHRDGRNKRPTGAVMDSSSVKGTPVRGSRGFDAAKKIDGINATSQPTPPGC